MWEFACLLLFLGFVIVNVLNYLLVRQLKRTTEQLREMNKLVERYQKK